jgi:hypothetical protein
VGFSLNERGVCVRQGFDRLSPNGMGWSRNGEGVACEGFDRLSPNGVGLSPNGVGLNPNGVGLNPN